MRVSSRLENAAIPGRAGPLEALVRIPPAPAGAAVMAHPHPLFGGTMHNKIVHAAAKVLADRLGLLAVRFNFRGVGTSAGSHDEGRGEIDDVVAAFAWARDRLGAPADSAGRDRVGGSHLSHLFVLGGFSFGSLCALRAQPRVKADALLLVGVPLDRMDPAETELASGAPVVWIHGADDTVAPPRGARETAARAGWDLALLPLADHFFTGRLAAFEKGAEEGLRRALGVAA